MSKVVYLRIIGYTTTILMHVGNIIYMNFLMKATLKEDTNVQLKAFSKLQSRYFTCWTFFLQILHAVVGIILDYRLLSNSNNKHYKPPKYLNGFKKTLFSAILWPSTWVVFTVFWSLYYYDRQLIYPSFVDKVLTSTSNHIMHTLIIGVVFWEVCFQPRNIPRSHKRNLYHLAFHFLFYFSILTYTYIEHGIWIYPIFAFLYGTIYFIFLPVTIGAMAVLFYYMQWTLTKAIWGKEGKNTKKR